MVAKIVASFAGKPYRVIAPVRSLLEKVPGTHVPQNVMVTGWLPALQINRMADISVIHGGIGVHCFNQETMSNSVRAFV